MENRADKIGRIQESLTGILPKVGIIMVFALCFYVFWFAQNEQTKFMRDAETVENRSMQIEGLGDLYMPYSLAAKADTKYIIKDVIPNEVPERYAMMFYSMYSSCRVFVDGVEIGSYGTRLPLNMGKLIGNIRVIIPIDPRYAGKTVTLEMIPYYNMNMDIDSIKYGYVDDLKLGIIYANMLRIVVCAVMFTLLLISCSVIVFEAERGTSIDLQLFVFFSFFVLTVMLWIICSSDIPQFFTNCNEGVSLISFLCLSLIGVAFVGFSKSVLTMGTKVLDWLYLFGWLLPILNVVSFFAEICDPMVLLPLTHIYVVASAVLTLIFSVRGSKESVTARMMMVNTVVLIVTTFVALGCFYVAPSKGYDASVFGIGLGIYFFGLFGIIVHRMVRVLEEDRYISAYKEMAFKDILTGLGNRQSFERFFDDIDNQNVENKTITLFMFDLNYLKVVNDKYGHQAGDAMLMGIGKCLRKTYENIGKAYRLGGDEFAAVVVGYANEILNIVDRLQNSIEEYNKTSEHHISTAIGYATGKYNKGDVDFYIRLFREADDMMYANKLRCHEESGIEMRDKRTE